MKHAWQVWLVFLLCVGGAAAAMGWLTQEAIYSDTLRRTAQAAAELEQRVSLALWRMDTELAPLITAEAVRPPSAYRTTFHPRPAAPQQQAFQQVGVHPQAAWQQATIPQVPRPQAASVRPHDGWLPSPTFAVPPEYVLLQFEARSDGRWHSPQVPDPRYRADAASSGVAPAALEQWAARLTELESLVRFQRLLADLPTASLPSSSDLDTRPLAGTQGFSGDESSFEGNSWPNTDPKLPVSSPKGEPAPAKGGKKSKAADFDRRSLNYKNLAEQSLQNLRQQASGAPVYSPTSPSGAPVAEPRPVAAIDEPVGISRPVWVTGRLLLARRAGAEAGEAVQGCWLDWPRIKARLLSQVTDLLPGADLLPESTSGATDVNRLLAGLPVRLVVGPSMPDASLNPALRWALWMGWGSLALAALAAAALLKGVMALSERRATFVSSVTHELRTPLTTFRMYAEMLARGMVPDEVHRREYLQTLQHEAERLTLLVENVLAYARLERGRKPQRGDRVTIDALLERIRPRVEHRAAQADMQCVMQLAPSTGSQAISTDVNVVEQIVFNLVDNAAKYARTATDRRIHLQAARDTDWLCLHVVDHGPGIGGRAWPWRTRAFCKSAEESAESASPGIGLGLSLCRRLAGQLGGRLEVHETPGGGTTVTLFLPLG